MPLKSMDHRAVNTKVFAVICLTVLLFIVLPGCAGEPEGEISEKEPQRKEALAAQAAQAYLDALAAGDEESFLEMMNSTWAGSYIMTSGDVTMPLEEAEEKGLLLKERTEEETQAFMLRCFRDQRQFVAECFGGDAWSRVEFTMEESVATEGRGGYILAATGEEITEEEYLAVNQEFWREAAKKEELAYEEIFPENPEDWTFEGHTAFLKYLEDEPGKLHVFPDYDVYSVHLTFSGKAISDNGYENFRFLVSNKNGRWGVQEGLVWQGVNAGSPESDI